MNYHVNEIEYEGKTIYLFDIDRIDENYLRAESLDGDIYMIPYYGYSEDEGVIEVLWDEAYKEDISETERSLNQIKQIPFLDKVLNRNK